MNFNRRRFIGGFVAGAAGLVASRGFASVNTGGQPELLPRAMAALDSHASSILHRDMMGIVDFAAPSHLPRLHLVDLGNGRVASSMLVAHGRGSDPANSGWVRNLSTRPGSNASSQGSFLTGDTYAGKHGRSRRVLGLDPENSLAEARGIVIHAASYVDGALAVKQGRIGRSEGCFAVSHAEIGTLLDQLGPGRLLFASL